MHQKPWQPPQNNFSIFNKKNPSMDKGTPANSGRWRNKWRNLNLVVPAPWAKHWGFKLEKHVNEMVGWVMEIKLIATHSLGGWDDFHQTWAALMDKNLCDVVGMWFLHWNVNQKRSVTRNPRVKSSRNHALPVVNVNLSPGFWTTKPDDETSIHKSGNYYRFLSVARRMLDMGLDPWLQWAGVFCWTCI